MKKLLLPLTLLPCIAFGQETIPATGSDATGSGGTVSYTVGQVVYTTNTGTNASMAQGVQQPYEIYSVGIEEAPADISLSTFPNPTQGLLTLEFDDYANQAMDYQIVDLHGKIMLTERINSAHTQIDLSAFVQGTYFIKVIKDAKSVKTYKIIKN